MRKLLDGMRSFWNSVEAVDVVARVFPMCCIRLSLLNIHQAIQPITVLFGSQDQDILSFLTDMANSFSKNAFDAKAISQQDKCVCQRDAGKCRLQEVEKHTTTQEEPRNCACDAHALQINGSGGEGSDTQ